MSADGGANCTQEDGKSVASQALWDEIEAKYWESISIYREDEDKVKDAPYHDRSTSLSLQQLKVAEKRSKLMKEADSLRRRLEAISVELEHKDKEISHIEGLRQDLGRNYRAEQASRAEVRAQEDARRREWFAEARLKAIKNAPKPQDAETPPPKEVVAPALQPKEPEMIAPGQDQHMVDAPNYHQPTAEAPSQDDESVAEPPSRHQPVLPTPSHDQPMVDAPAPMPAATMAMDPTTVVSTAAAPTTPAPTPPAPKAAAPMTPAPVPAVPMAVVPVAQPEAPIATVLTAMVTVAQPAAPTPTVPTAVVPVAQAAALLPAVPTVVVPVAPAAAPTLAIPMPVPPMPAAPMDTESNNVQPASETAEPEAPTNDETQPSPSALSSELSTPLSEPPLQLDAELEAEVFHRRQGHGVSSGESAPAENMQTWIDVIEGSGEPVDRLRRIELDNHFAHEVVRMPIRRPIRLRVGKSLTDDIKDAIYQPTDAKGARWLACEIQATGEEQTEPCQKCTRGTGPFQECVSLGTTDLPRCGNCEWNKQSCSLHHKTSDDTSDRPTPQSTSFTAVNTPKQTAEPGDAISVNVELGDAGEHSLSESVARKSLPSSKAEMETPMVGTPMSGSPAPAVAGSGEEEDLPEINKSVLVLRDDGAVFTEPPCIAGVPLAKIGPDHPYWEPEWQNIEEVVTPQLQKWREKFEYHMTANSSQSSKFLANRQINRGKTILKFLEDGELHPYQIFGKEHVNRQLANYDTLYRMVQILEELAKFHIDITPSQWLRQRLYEIYMELGDDFNLAKTVHDLYHDPKVMQLRVKSGFGNIGRPSGYNRAVDGGGSRKPSKGQKRKEPHITPKGTPTKGTASPIKVNVAPIKEAVTTRGSGATPKKAPMKAETKEPILPPPPPPPPVAEPQPFRPRSSHRKSRGVPSDQRDASASASAPPPAPPTKASKKARLVPSLPPSRQDLECDGYTTSDSFSHDTVMQVDWRVYQIKHRECSTNGQVTQYWHYVDRSDPGSEETMFEHQVLKDVIPGRRLNVEWGVYKEPIDFHLRFRELTEITYAPDSLNIIIGTKPVRGVTHRGDLVAQFKRERTKRRFLKFMEGKGIRLVKTSHSYVDDAWTKMESDVLPSCASEGED